MAVQYYVWKNEKGYGCSYDFGEVSFSGKESDSSLAEENLKKVGTKIMLK